MISSCFAKTPLSEILYTLSLLLSTDISSKSTKKNVFPVTDCHHGTTQSNLDTRTKCGYSDKDMCMATPRKSMYTIPKAHRHNIQKITLKHTDQQLSRHRTRGSFETRKPFRIQLTRE